MLEEEGKYNLEPKDIEQNSLWVFSDMDDLLYPVKKIEDIKDYHSQVYAKAEFQTKKGVLLNGYTIGIHGIYCVGICGTEEIFHFNKNLLIRCKSNLRFLCKSINKRLVIKDFSPLIFRTKIEVEGIPNYEGYFDLLKPTTIEEQLYGIIPDDLDQL